MGFQERKIKWGGRAPLANLLMASAVLVLLGSQGRNQAIPGAAVVSIKPWRIPGPLRILQGPQVPVGGHLDSRAAPS